MWNRRNLHVWAHVNPFPRRPTGHQYRWSVNVWAGIIGSQIVGPIFLPPRLNSGNYLEFIEEHLVDIMDSLPLARRQRTWFQQDGAPAHSSTIVRNRLNELFDNRLISRFCTHAWPPRSPDLTPLDFFLWGRIKDDVFSSECESVEDMTSRIRAAFDKLREECTQDGDLLPRVHEETAWRAQMCEEVRGQHIENRGLRRGRERRN